MIDFARVNPTLFVGTCPSNEVDIKQIRLMGVTGVLNLQTDDDFLKWQVNFAEVQQASYDLDLVIQRVPIIDFDDEDLKAHLPAAVNLLNRMIAVGHTIYLHCTAGRDRSPTVATAYLAQYKDMTVDQAAAHLTSARDCRPKVELIKHYLQEQKK